MEVKRHQINIIHPEGSMNVCTECHGNPSWGCQDISLKSNVNLMVALKEQLQSFGSPSEDYECLNKISWQSK